jgi:hypothetical protein
MLYMKMIYYELTSFIYMMWYIKVVIMIKPYSKISGTGYYWNIILTNDNTRDV